MSDQTNQQTLRETERRSLILEGATGEMSKRLDDMHTDIRELRGDIRDLRDDNKTMTKAMNAGFIEIEKRLNKQFWRLLLSVFGLLVAVTLIERVFP